MRCTLLNNNHIQLFHEGRSFRSYEVFGAKMMTINGEKGVAFTVWAPQAEKVSVVGDFNDWNRNHHVMEKINTEGIWHLFVSEVEAGARYMYHILAHDHQTHLKADPYANFSEVRPGRASIVYPLDGYQWEDTKWIQSRKRKEWQQSPINIYELHVGSWKKKAGETGVDAFYTYRELVVELIPYLKAHQFTHVELMPIVEHPYDPSWGYQGTGYFSATSRYGTPHDLMYFIDQCHQFGIGVLLDWVPGHFCKDDHGLYLFDGRPTYEYHDPAVRENVAWGTANFNLGRKEVQSFLISNALFWLDCFHFDGLRIDAVKEMLYWELDGIVQENALAVTFLQKLNGVIEETHPSALICAEDSSVWPGVTKSVSEGGLGFTYKWNMGWMNDILRYVQIPTSERKHHHGGLTFPMWYAYSEQYLLPLSHDEVVHEKRSLINKMPGDDDWQKFANLRLLYGFMYTHPGKKLLFMGGEFAQVSEWNELAQLEWHLLEDEKHTKMSAFTKTLFTCYYRSKPLWQLDHHPDGFTWIDVDNNEQSICSFIRFAENGDYLIMIFNFTPKVYHDYQVGVPSHGRYGEVLNSDDVKYGGSGKVNKRYLQTIYEPFHNQPCQIKLTLPPLGMMILKPVKSRSTEKNERGGKEA